MKIKFCGAAQNVTGSAHLITLDSGYTILLDCGLFQGSRKEVGTKNQHWHFEPRNLDCLILSHAHIDHTGRVPKLVNDGFEGPIYATHATRSLCAIMLLDSALIQERDADYNNRRAKKSKSKTTQQLEEPLYRAKDIPSTLNRFVGLGYDQWHQIHPQVALKYVDAGHIIGSASLVLRIEENGKTTMLGFTGDIGRPNRPILRDPQPLPPVDYLICESTYGDRLHESAPDQSEKLRRIIQETCLQKRGKLIIPAFSVGRTQEIVYMMDQMANAGILPKIPVYVDSPLAVNATEVYGAHPECFDQELNQYLLIDENPFGFNGLKYVRSVEESKKLNASKEPCVIISSSGMMNAGRIVHHLYNNVTNPHNTFLIVGYCAPGTHGATLRDGAQSIRIFGDELPIRAEIEVMDSFSAHGDQKEMLDVIITHKDTAHNTFLVHGDIERITVFKKYLELHGFKGVEAPYEGETFQLS